MTISKPKPILDVWNRPFWGACADHRLQLQRCVDTGKCWYPPAPVSPYSPKGKWEWVDCSGQGEIVSWVVFHHNYFAGFADEIPYNVTLVRLAEGALMLTNVLGGNDHLVAGAPVEVVFEERGDVVVPVFKLKEMAI
jgi:uncharacterized OB-fold protein